MDRRQFIGSIVAAGGILAAEKVEASPLSKLGSIADAPKRKAGKFDENLVVIISDLHTNPDGYQPDKLRIVVDKILSMKPLPANVVALGDLAYLTGQVSEYALLKPIIQPIEDAGIKLTLAMGNHDRRDNFAAAFPEHAKATKVPGRYVSIVETPYADIIVLDSLQQGKDDKTWITPGALNDEQVEWLKATLAAYTKPVFVSAHHPIDETKVAKILLASPTCCGYIYGHDHRWRLDWVHTNYSDRRMIRTLCMPSTGHWGDIGYTTLRLDSEKAVAQLHESEFFFPVPAKDGDAPLQWKAIKEEQDGNTCTFMYKL